MPWIYLLLAGLFEIGFALGLNTAKASPGGGRHWAHWPVPASACGC